MEGDGPMSDVVALQANMQQARSELAIFRAPGGEAFVIAVDLDDVLAPEGLVAALHAAKRGFGSREDAAEQRAAQSVCASLQAGRQGADVGLVAAL